MGFLKARGPMPMRNGGYSPEQDFIIHHDIFATYYDKLINVLTSNVINEFLISV